MPLAARGLGAPDQRATAEHQVDVADGDGVAVVQDRGFDARAVDEGAVDAAVVADLGAAGGRDQRRVVARRQHIGDDDVVVGVAADLDRPGQARRRAGPAAGSSACSSRGCPRCERGAAAGPIAVTDSSAGCGQRRLSDLLATSNSAPRAGWTASRCSSAAGRSGTAAAGSTGSPAAGRTGTAAGGTRAAAASAAAGGPRAAGAPGDRYRRGRRPAHGLLPAHLEGQLRAVRVADVDVHGRPGCRRSAPGVR